MATVEDRINSWAKEELRGDSQINMDVAVAWYNKGLQQFQKTILEYVSGKQSTSVTFADIKKGVDEYPLPVFDNESHVEDFYSIVQLRVAYHNTDKYSQVKKYSKYDSSATYYKYTGGDYVIEENPKYANLLTSNYYIKNGDNYVIARMYSPYNAGTTYYVKIGFESYEIVSAGHANLLTRDYYLFVEEGYPLYRVCKPMDFGDYNINPLKNFPDTGEPKKQGGHQVGGPYIWGKISETNPRYIFVPKYEKGEYKSYIKIFPTPVKDIDRGLTLTYNFIQQPVTKETDEGTLNLPRYFFDAIEDYMTFRLYQAENPEMAQWYYQQFQQTVNDNIYGLNKDKRPVEEGFANTSYFSHY